MLKSVNNAFEVELETPFSNMVVLVYLFIYSITIDAFKII